jgi:hypothetical protein
MALVGSSLVAVSCVNPLYAANNSRNTDNKKTNTLLNKFWFKGFFASIIFIF